MIKNSGEKLKKIGKKVRYYVLLGLFISAIAVVHFSMQLSFVQKEYLRSVQIDVNSDEDIPTRGTQIIKIAPEIYEIKEIEVVSVPEFVKPPTAPRQKEAVSPSKSKPTKKKEATETRAERIRRAERILTGA